MLFLNKNKDEILNRVKVSDLIFSGNVFHRATSNRVFPNTLVRTNGWMRHVEFSERGDFAGVNTLMSFCR